MPQSSYFSSRKIASSPGAASRQAAVDRTMKKKIIFGLSIFALMFFFGGVYIVMTTETTIFELHRLSQLHRTVALRKDLLLSIKKNQDNLILRNRHFAMEEASGEQSMTAIVEKCFAWLI